MNAKKPARITAVRDHAGQSCGSDSPPSNSFGEEGGEGANSFNGYSQWSNRILPKMAKIRLTFKEEPLRQGNDCLSGFFAGAEQNVRGDEE